MTRDEMLNTLHSINVAVRLTALTSENALECLYMTSRGTKEEWIGLNEWPVSIKKESSPNTYILELNGIRHEFSDYGSFISFFENEWIGDVTPWDQYNDEELSQWIELVSIYDGIPTLS